MEILILIEFLATKEGDASLEVCDHNLRAAVAHVAYVFASVSKRLKTVVPEWTEYDLSCRRRSYQIKGRVSWNTNAYIALA
jgi:hypothetical protein